MKALKKQAKNLVGKALKANKKLIRKLQAEFKKTKKGAVKAKMKKAKQLEKLLKSGQRLLKKV